MFRENFRTAFDKTERLVRQLGMDQDILLQFADARGQLEGIDYAELVDHSETLALQIGKLARLLDRLNTDLPDAPPAETNAFEEFALIQDQDEGFSPHSGTAWSGSCSGGANCSAPYPALSGANAANFDNTNVDPGLDSDPDSLPGGGSSMVSAGQCNINASPYNTHQALLDTRFTTLLVSTIAEGVQMVAQDICSQTVLVNTSLACIPTDLIFLALRSAYDFISLCGDHMTAAEVTGSYVRLGHLHVDMEAAQASVNMSNNRLTTLSSNLNALSGDVGTLSGDVSAGFTTVTNEFGNLTTTVNGNTAQVTMLIANSTTQLNNALNVAVTQLNVKLDQQNTALNLKLDQQQQTLVSTLQTNRDFFLRERIERALLNDEQIALYFLPEAFGGNLDRVRTIVIDSIANLSASGQSTQNSDTWVATGDRRRDAGNFKMAWQAYSLAYRMASGRLN